VIKPLVSLMRDWQVADEAADALGSIGTSAAAQALAATYDKTREARNDFPYGLDKAILRNLTELGSLGCWSCCVGPPTKRSSEATCTTWRLGSSSSGCLIIGMSVLTRTLCATSCGH
jgi:hypothetical protein